MSQCRCPECLGIRLGPCRFGLGTEKSAQDHGARPGDPEGETGKVREIEFQDAVVKAMIRGWNEAFPGIPMDTDLL